MDQEMKRKGFSQSCPAKQTAQPMGEKPKQRVKLWGGHQYVPIERRIVSMRKIAMKLQKFT
jgi:hypothetical protein